VVEAIEGVGGRNNKSQWLTAPQHVKVGGESDKALGDKKGAKPRTHILRGLIFCMADNID